MLNMISDLLCCMLGFALLILFAIGSYRRFKRGLALLLVIIFGPIALIVSFIERITNKN